jgi:hypothetical protein
VDEVGGRFEWTKKREKFVGSLTLFGKPKLEASFEIARGFYRLAKDLEAGQRDLQASQRVLQAS